MYKILITFLVFTQLNFAQEACSSGIAKTDPEFNMQLISQNQSTAIHLLKNLI